MDILQRKHLDRGIILCCKHKDIVRRHEALKFRLSPERKGEKHAPIGRSIHHCSYASHSEES